MPGFGFRYGAGRSRRKLTSGTVATALALVAADGFTVTAATAFTGYEPNVSAQITRQGYDGSYTMVGGVPTPTLRTDITDTVKIRHAKRNVYPDDNSEPVFSTTIGTLATYFYTTDSAPGCTNNSAVLSPKPTAGWAWYDRRVVGNTLNVQLVAYHRNVLAGIPQPVACAVIRATDGTNTTYQIVNVTSVLTTPGGHPFADVRIEGLECNIDLSGLNDNAEITLNGRVFPFVGDSRSVLDSADQANLYEFAPQKYWRSTTLAASPPLAYVSNTGTDAAVDANGQAAGITKVSTNPATARANPFATVTAALHALKAATAVTGGFTDGCEVRLMDAVTWNTNVTAGTYTRSAGVIITRDPSTANRAAAPLTVSSIVNTRQGVVIFRDIKLVRSANVQPTLSGVGLCWIFDGVDYNAGGFASAWSGSTAATLYHCSVAVSNSVNQVFAPGGACHALVRGCSIVSGTASSAEAGVVIGNKCAMPTAHATRQLTRSIVVDNIITVPVAAGSMAIWAGNLTWNNPVLVGNVFECLSSTTGGSAPHPSSDGGTGSMVNFIAYGNTFAGDWLALRQNWLYDETVGTPRGHVLHLNEANVFVCLTTKTQYFLGMNGGADATEIATHTLNDNIVYGVDYNYLFCQWWDAGDVGLPSAMGYATLAQRWAHYSSYTYGDNSMVPTSRVRLDPKFKANAAVAWNGSAYVAGAGGGDYRPQRMSQGDANDSPLIGKVVRPRRRFDLRGVARASVNDTIGAYA